MNNGSQKRTWLLLDVSYLCYRAFYTMGHLTHGDIQTGVPFGVLRELHQLVRDFQTPHVVFCFDYGRPLRATKLPEYKSNRNHSDDPEKQAQRRQVRKQMQLLREEYLPDIGFRNLCFAEGYEADDLIASAVAAVLERRERAVIVSADHDLYQLLGRDVIIWDCAANDNYTSTDFESEYGVTPSAWVDVKSIAGCKTDNIPGIRGVGEVTAAKYLAGKLSSEYKTYKSIVNGNDIWLRNREIVRLPYPGTPDVTLCKDEVSDHGWRTVLAKLGIKSLHL